MRLALAFLLAAGVCFGQTTLILNPVSGVSMPDIRLSVPFSEGDGNPDFTGTEGSGTASCTDLAWATSPTAGDFNGTTSVCDVGTIVDKTDAYTLAACIQPDDFGESGQGRIFHKESSGTSSYVFSVQDGNDSLNAYVFGSTGSDQFHSGDNSLVPDGTTWFRVLFSVSGATTDSPSAQFYIDGSPVTATLFTDTKSGNVDDSAFPFHIGNRGDTARTFNGRIRLVVAYADAVDAAQASADFSLNPCGS